MVRVLLAEDDVQIQDLTRRFLEIDRNLQTEVVTSAEEALERLGSRDFDAVVSDYEMPGMDGISFLKAVRESGSSIPFIIFTGKGTEQVAIEALNNGADFYLRKDGDPKTLFTQLRNMILHAVEQRKVREALTQSIRRLSDIINAIPDATFAIDSGGKIIAWNRAIEQMTGIPSRDMLGQENREYSLPFHTGRRPMLVDLIFASDEEVMRNGYHAIRRTERSICAEITTDTPGQGRKDLWIVATPLFDEKGGVAGAIESIRDISESRRVTEALGEKTGILQTLFRSSVIGIALLDQDLEPVESNELFSRLFGGNSPGCFSKHMPRQVFDRIIEGKPAVFEIRGKISGNPEGKLVICVEKVPLPPGVDVRYLAQVSPAGNVWPGPV
ncbi:MAG: response regulator [Methanoregulaceae archaeon]|nr:response regulator [Methanoregulaceae archaeon]